MRPAILLTVAACLALAACNHPPAPQPVPEPARTNDYHLPTGSVTNGCTVVTYYGGVPDLAPEDLARQLWAAGARPNVTNATEWTFDAVDTPAKRAAIEAVLLQGGRFKPTTRP